jgi:hypothetical protein
MTWERRKGSGRYYTQSRRVSGRIVREYIGSGPDAELIARIDEQDRAARLAAAAEMAARRASEEALDAELDRLCHFAEMAGRAALLDAGFHRHRGQWRKRRGKPRSTENA